MICVVVLWSEDKYSKHKHIEGSFYSLWWVLSVMTQNFVSQPKWTFDIFHMVCYFGNSIFFGAQCLGPLIMWDIINSLLYSLLFDSWLNWMYLKSPNFGVLLTCNCCCWKLGPKILKIWKSIGTFVWLIYQKERPTMNIFARSKPYLYEADISNYNWMW